MGKKATTWKRKGRSHAENRSDYSAAQIGGSEGSPGGYRHPRNHGLRSPRTRAAEGTQGGVSRAGVSGRPAAEGETGNSGGVQTHGGGRRHFGEGGAHRRD